MKAKIFARGIEIPFSVKTILLKPAAKYWRIEVWPNLNSRLADPKINLESLIIFIKGKWYNPASGLFEFSKTLSESLLMKLKLIFLKFLFLTNKFS